MRLLLGFLLGWAAFAQAATTSTVTDIPAADGSTQRFLHVRPDAPVATLVNIPGGDGRYNFASDGSSVTAVGQCSPPYRNRAALADRGIAVVLIDATTSGTVGQFENVLAVIREVRRRDNAPIWISGGSASTIATAFAASSLPADIPGGVLFVSPDRPPATVSQITRPAGVIYHASDTLAFGSLVYNALTASVARERQAITGGTNAGCGFHLFNGTDTELVNATVGMITRLNPATGGAPLNVQGLWYKSPAESEAGWGLNIAHQGDILFVTWFTYDVDGSQMWLVGSRIEKMTGNNYSGTLYRTTGPAFNAMPFTPITAANLTAVGTVNLSFADSGNGTFQYTVNGITQSKAIVRQVFGPLPTCTTGGTPGTPPNFQDLWYASPAESEAGWGLNVTHQGDIVFMTWFTYDLNGRGMWIVGSRMERSGGDTFTGALYRTTGPAFNAVPFTPITAANLTQVGTGTLAFSSAAAGTFSYTVNGVAQTKNIMKQSFGPATVCR